MAFFETPLRPRESRKSSVVKENLCLPSRWAEIPGGSGDVGQACRESGLCECEIQRPRSCFISSNCSWVISPREKRLSMRLRFDAPCHGAELAQRCECG